MSTRAPRNPFTLRASELIESDGTFLRLFGPGVLDLLQAEQIWNRVQPIYSAPGGGKTSLFRLFTPACLLTLYDSRATAEEFKDLNRRLKEISAISEDGPSVLGIMISGVGRDADLESLPLDQARKNRLFFSLLNSRIAIATLRSALELKKLTFPDDLHRIFIQRPKVSDFPTSIPIPCTGDVLMEWASDSEKQVCRYIDSFAPSMTDTFIGYDTLYCLYFLQSDCISLDGQPVSPRSLLMIDNIERLTKTQRTILFNALVNLRVPTGVWLAERLEALTPRELFGAEVGREYEKPIVLEEFWRNESTKYEQVIANIADRRAKLNPDIQMGPFQTCLQDSLDSAEWKAKYLKAIETISIRVCDKVRSTKRYEKWITKCEAQDGTLREKAIGWRVLEVKIERDRKKAQKQLVDSPLPEEGLEMKVEASTREAAELLLSREFHLPYYFGFQNLVKLSSSNIEQFLVFASELFEEVISAKLLKQPTALSPYRQESILTRTAQKLWDDIPLASQDGRDVARLLSRMGEMCLTETIKPNAPYAPGVTGIALSMKDRDRLINPHLIQSHPELARLSSVLSSCISHNYLLMHSGVRQGPKGVNTWTVLYLNRWLCLHFGLPFQYGGWRPMKTIELIKYIWSEPQKTDRIGAL